MNAMLLHGKLPAHSLLQTLDQDELAHLLRDAREQKSKKGEHILRQGDDGDFLVILLEGQARVTVYTANGREIVLSYASAGDVVGEIALLDGGPRSASVIAMTPVRYLTLSRTVFERVMSENHEIALRLLRELAHRLRVANRTIENDRAYSAGPRLARFLLRLVKDEGMDDGLIRLSQTELAMFAGISRENINRQLSLWQQNGLISLDQGKINVVDIEWLEDVADALE